MSPALAGTTIAAIATPLGEGGIGILRMSGPGCRKIFGAIWSGKKLPAQFESHRLYHGWICDPATDSKVDTVMACWMQAPHSYTGEDVLEISAHGSPLVLKKILALLFQHGARAAEPGEFTKRAFLNGRIDLTQAEAVAAMIGAKSEAMLSLAERGLSGALKNQIHELRQSLVASMGRLEASVDFPEEDLGLEETNAVQEMISQVTTQIETLLKNYDEGQAYRDGVTVAIVGRPNVGKSSLLNRLVGRDRAIVHDQPGTTRDTIEEEIKLDGILFRLIDTAGQRDGAEPVEQQGIERARRAQGEADFTLAVIDRAAPLHSNDLEILGRLRTGSAIILLNKIDLPEMISEREAAERAPSVPMLPISAKTGVGIDPLKKILLQLTTSHAGEDARAGGIFNIRHRDLLTKAHQSLATALASIARRESSEFASSLVRQGADHLAEITGEITTEEILGEIFSKFCIGK